MLATTSLPRIQTLVPFLGFLTVTPVHIRQICMPIFDFIRWANEFHAYLEDFPSHLNGRHADRNTGKHLPNSIYKSTTSDPYTENIYMECFSFYIRPSTWYASPVLIAIILMESAQDVSFAAAGTVLLPLALSNQQRYALLHALLLTWSFLIEFFKINVPLNLMSCWTHGDQ